MFRHQGKSRTLQHNLRIATVLSFVAGIVNVTGFLSIKQLTTNVTGHFALFINDVADLRFWKGSVYLLYIFSFLLGSFIAGLLIEKFKENKKLNVFVLPTLIECLVLTAVAVLCLLAPGRNADLVACMLLFAMGLQNSYVTKISDAVVRTTHLTGLFTDLGIELAQLFFREFRPHRQQIKATIKLRISIIAFFFLGGLVGGFLFSEYGLGTNTLFLAVLVLLAGLFYDDMRFRFIKTMRRQRSK